MSTTEASDLIVDVGAHKGEDSDFYLKLGFRVVAIEANPSLCDRLRVRFSQEIRYGRYTLIDKAIGEAPGEVTFYENKKLSIWGTTNPDWAKRNKGLGAGSNEIRVKSIPFSEVIEQFGCPYYLKIDVEGADMLCVRALMGTSCRPKYISIESTKTSWLGLLQEFAALESLGYFRFKVVDQRRHKNGEFKGRNGQFVSHAFEKGASGPFGDNLDGPWLTKKQAIRRYVPIFILYKTIGDNTLLSKILSRIPGLRQVLQAVSWFDTHAMRECHPDRQHQSQGRALAMKTCDAAGCCNPPD
jgi:FkbM family methyltransferase